jgi:hypothetical protein
MMDPAGFEPATWRLAVDVVLQAFAVTEVFKEAAATKFNETKPLSYISVRRDSNPHLLRDEFPHGQALYL